VAVGPGDTLYAQPMSRPTAEESISPLWLAHHYPDDYDRCVVIGRTHVCRRCLALYPLAFVVMVLALAGVRWPTSIDPWLLIALPLPSVVEFVLEHLGVVRHQPVRQVLLTLPLAVALGVGFARYLHRPTDPLFWGVVVVYAGMCLASTLVGTRRPSA
jgi:uncharacterized membrane protein